MPSNHYHWLEKILYWVVILGSFLVVFVPLIVIKESYFPYIIQKSIFLRIIIEAVFAAWLVLALTKPEYRPKKSLIFWAVLSYFAVMVITTFTSQSFFRSWWGNWERSLGTFSMLHYLMWFVALISVFKTPKDWFRLLNLSLFVSLLISIYAIAQRLGSSFILQSGLERVSGTIGNASFLASYMLIHLFIALFFFVEKNSWKWKGYYLAVLVIDLFVLILTGTRGAFLALFISLIGFIVLAFWQGAWRGKTFKILIIVSLALIIGCGVLYALREKNFVSDNYWLRRLSGFSLEDNTIQTRLHSWLWGLKGFRDNLLVGVGPENYSIVFDRYFEGDFYNYTGNEIWFDRAHNTLVDQAATTGIFGLLTYLFIFGAAAYCLLELKKKNILSRPTFIVLALLFFSYFFQNLFVFDSLNSYILFFMLLAYVNYLYQKFTSKAEAEKPGTGRILPMAISLPVVVILAGLLIFYVNVREIKANQITFIAYAARINRDYYTMVDNYEKARNISINRFDPAVLMASSLNELVGTGIKDIPKDRQIEDLNKAADWLAEAIKYDDQNMFLHYLQSKTYALLTEISLNPKYLEKGIAYANRAKELSPHRIRPDWILAQLYLFGSQPEKSLSHLKIAEAINPRLPETYFYESIVYKTLNDEENLYATYDKMIDNGYSFIVISQVNDAIPHYDELGDIKRLIYLIEELTRLEPDDINNWNKLVDLLILDKQYDRALRVLQKAADEMPAFTSRAYSKYLQINELIKQEQQNEEAQNQN
ncbi:MAG TPA: O-antigen ligase family protein [Patescibacteria group bacterium]|nr:O-antigen ligase family protein [Patescibacteria group bacterium]